MALSERENYLRNVTMTGPEWMPCGFYVSDASRNQARGEFEEVMARHPILFPGFKKGERNYATYEFAPANRAGERFTDSWGCVWLSDINGIEGQVIEHPLDDWSKLKDYKVPDPLKVGDREPVNWEENRKRVLKDKEEGRTAIGWTAHGFLFLGLLICAVSRILCSMWQRTIRICRISSVKSHGTTNVSSKSGYRWGLIR